MHTILDPNGETVRTRAITARETARLLGLPEEHELPPAATDAFHLLGDGVAVPVVRHTHRTVALGRKDGIWGTVCFQFWVGVAGGEARWDDPRTQTSQAKHA